MSEFLGIYIKTLGDGEFQFCQTGLKKAYMFKPKLHTSGMKSCEMVCYISVL